MLCFKFIKIKDLSFKNNKVSKEIEKVKKEQKGDILKETFLKLFIHNVKKYERKIK